METTDIKVGNEFNPYGLGYWRNSSKPYSIEVFKGYHPNIMEITNTLKITKIEGDAIIFNDGEYIIDKKYFNKSKI